MGPLKELTIDHVQERGFIGPLFSDMLQEMGVKVTSIAGQAHWQHGQIERHIGILKDMMSRAVKHTQTSGPEQMGVYTGKKQFDTGTRIQSGATSFRARS